MVMLDRRSAIGVVVGLVATAPLAVLAQPNKPARIGFVSNSSPASGGSQFEAFRLGLRDLGWIEGRNLTIERRWSEGRSDRLPAIVDELVRGAVDVIVVSGPSAIAAAS